MFSAPLSIVLTFLVFLLATTTSNTGSNDSRVATSGPPPGAKSQSASALATDDLSKPPSAPEGDCARVDTALTQEADSLAARWDANSWRQAIQKYQANLGCLKDPVARNKTLHSIGKLYYFSGEPRAAIRYFELALERGRRQKPVPTDTDTLIDLALAQLSLSENAQAFKSLKQADVLSRSFHYKSGTARTLTIQGELELLSARFQKSLDLYARAIQIWKEVDDPDGQAQTLLDIGYSYSDLNDTQSALDSYEKALALWRGVKNLRGEALTLTARGHLFSKMGEKQKALDDYARALELLTPMEDGIAQGVVFNGMGYVHGQLGQNDSAAQDYQGALELFRKAGYKYGEEGSLSKLGEIFSLLGDDEKALDYLRASLKLSEQLRNPRMQAIPVSLIGGIHQRRGEWELSLESYFRALALNRAGADRREEAHTLSSIAGVLAAKGDLAGAMQNFSRALTINRATEDRFDESTNLARLARLQQKLGDLPQARSYIEQALKVVESLRTKVLSGNSRSSYFATVHENYELYIDILMQLHKQQPANGLNAVAFDVSERARARSLLESLKEERADIREGVEPSLLKRERDSERELSTRVEHRAELVSQNNLKEAEAAAKEIDRLSTEYDEVRAQIRSQSPRYAALTQPQPLTLKEIQQRLLDDNTILLEYMLGEERSYVWAVTRTEVSSYELPGRAQIEDSARGLYNLLSAQQPKPGETLEQRLEHVREAQAQLPSKISILSNLLLGPVADKLGTKRLLVVPDGALQYIPFQALTVAANKNSTAIAGAGFEQQVPLVLDHEIINEPSASALALVLSESASRKPSPKSVAILADPVFEVGDSRIKSPNAGSLQAAATASPTGEITRAFRDVGVEGGEIPRLLSSREEAEAIMKVVPWRTGFKAVDFDANRTTAMGSDLGQYRVVHFATHALLDNEHPELSGIVLSMVDQKGEPQDGFLRLHDIYNLKLPVDLVVLSACQTGLGKDVKGEGLIGLTRAFMYAGASGVVASLWEVDDEATAELMKHFYAGMFEQGLSPAAALRQAQLAMRKQKRWQEPYYWAGFVIQGQYAGKLSGNRMRPATQVAMLGAVGGILMSVALLAVWQRRRRNL